MNESQKKFKYVIIGNSAAGLSAAKAIRSIDTKESIAVITFEKAINYSKPLISYFLAKKVAIDNVYFKEDDFYKKNKIDLLSGHFVEEIDFKNKLVTFKDKSPIVYEKLLISTGGLPIVPGIKVKKENNEFDLNKDNFKSIKGLFTFTTLEDAKDIKNHIDEYDIKEAIVLGGGLIGIKSLESLLDLKIKVSMVELSDRILPVSLDRQASLIMEDIIRENGSNIYLSNTISSIILKNNTISSVILQNGIKIESDLLIIAVGVKPNTEFIKNGKISNRMGITVDTKMKTAIEDVYAAGDVVKSFDLINEISSNIAIWPLAVRQGYIAGLNMAGRSSDYNGGFAMNSVEILGIPCISMGASSLDEESASSNNTEFLKEFKKDQKTYKKIIIKDNKIIGAKLIGNIERAGIYHGLIKNKIDISSVKDMILREDFGIIQLPSEYKKHLVIGEGIEV